MPPRKDRLEQNLERLREEAELDYAALGASIISIAYHNNAVRRAHGLRTATPSERQRGVAWQRGQRNFVLLEHEPAVSYQLNQWHMAEPPAEEEPEITLVKTYVFGEPEVAAGGLALVTVATGDADYTAKGFMREAWRRGRVTGDLSRIRRRLPTQTEKTSFQRSIFGILERQRAL